MSRWSLPSWQKGVGVSSETRRYAALSGGISWPNNTTLGDLRKFVASLDRWPDKATVTSENGSVIQVEFFEAADPMTTGETDR
jgi:hypothetical protein